MNLLVAIPDRELSQEGGAKFKPGIITAGLVNRALKTPVSEKPAAHEAGAVPQTALARE
jgi:hypothetical protein